jgi:hypothetical protein
MNKRWPGRRRIALCGCFVAKALLGFEAVHAAPDEETATTIHVAFKYHMDNLTSGWKGDVLEYFVLVLSARNKIQVSWRSEDADRHIKNYQFHQNTLGTQGNGSFHVESPHQLEQKLIYPQHVRTIDIVVNNNKCEASMRFALLPGFKLYLFPQIRNGQYQLYAKPIVLDSVCAIEQDSSENK